MNLPKEISPCPIIEAIIEIRFETEINPNAIFGIVYNEFRKDFPKVENLPILQIPEQLRLVDINLRHKPHYKISNEYFSIQIGPDIISFSPYPIYSGWDNFSKQIFEVLERISTIQVIKKLTRIGIRYINFFSEEIFSKINISVCVNTEKINYINTAVRTEIKKGNFSNTLQIANNINLPNKSGSVIDIDTFINISLEDFYLRSKEIINEGHLIEKELFFSLLSEDLLNSLNPKY